MTWKMWGLPGPVKKEPKPRKEMPVEWSKAPSVMTGGKAWFYHTVIRGKHCWVRWNRHSETWEGYTQELNDIGRVCDRTLCETASTPKQAMKVVEKAMLV